MQLFTIKITKGDIIGRAYFDLDKTTIFIAKIAQFALAEARSKNHTAFTAFGYFLAQLLETEIHEHIHMFLFSNLKQKQYSEKTVEFYSEKMLPLVAELVSKGYVECYTDVLYWMEKEMRESFKSKDSNNMG